MLRPPTSPGVEIDPRTDVAEQRDRRPVRVERADRQVPARSPVPDSPWDSASGERRTIGRVVARRAHDHALRPASSRSDVVEPHAEPTVLRRLVVVAQREIQHVDVAAAGMPCGVAETRSAISSSASISSVSTTWPLAVGDRGRQDDGIRARLPDDAGDERAVSRGRSSYPSSGPARSPDHLGIGGGSSVPMGCPPTLDVALDDAGAEPVVHTAAGVDDHDRGGAPGRPAASALGAGADE